MDRTGVEMIFVVRVENIFVCLCSKSLLPKIFELIELVFFSLEHKKNWFFGVAQKCVSLHSLSSQTG